MVGSMELFTWYIRALYSYRFTLRAIYRRFRPKPMAFSIFLSVLEAMAFAFSAPASKISSNSGESINA